jgi:cation diffusion facilitator family transporter
MARTRLQQGLRATFIGLTVNTLLAMCKLAAGLFGHSHALVADAVESMADILSSLVVWRALVVAATPADADHPYGHGKAEPLASAVVAALLLLAAVGITLQAVREVLQPKQGPAPYTLFVLLGVVLIKEGLFRFVLREAKSIQSVAVITDAWHHRSDAITSIAAAIGISVALLGGKGYEGADDVAAIFAACLIAWNGWRLLRPALSELMDQAPSSTLTEQIVAIAAKVPGTDRIEKCMVRKMGYRYFVDMHVEVDPKMTVHEAHGIAHRIKDEVRERIPEVADVLVHIEPRR